MQRAKATEHYGYISKPFDERELQTAIETAFTIPLIVAAVALVISALYVLWRRRHAPGAMPAALLMLVGAVWTLGYMMELAGM